MVSFSSKWHSSIFPLLNVGIQHRKEGIYSSSLIHQNSHFFNHMTYRKTTKILVLVTAYLLQVSPTPLKYNSELVLRPKFNTLLRLQGETGDKTALPQSTEFHQLIKSGNSFQFQVFLEASDSHNSCFISMLSRAALMRELLAFFKRI